MSGEQVKENLATRKKQGDMLLGDVYRRLRDLNLKIADDINIFETATGLSVKEVSLTVVESITLGKRESRVHKARVEVSL